MPPATENSSRWKKEFSPGRLSDHVHQKICRDDQQSDFKSRTMQFKFILARRKPMKPFLKIFIDLGKKKKENYGCREQLTRTSTRRQHSFCNPRDSSLKLKTKLSGIYLNLVSLLNYVISFFILLAWFLFKPSLC